MDAFSSIKNRLQAMSARQEEAARKVSKAPQVKAPPVTPAAPRRVEAKIEAVLGPAPTAAAEDTTPLGLDSLLTMSPDQIQKISPTGQFSKLKLALALSNPIAGEADTVKKLTGQIVLKPQHADAVTPTLETAKASAAPKPCLNDLLTMDSDELVGLGYIHE